MKPIYEMYICNIDITKHCHNACPYCIRYVRHLRSEQKYHMSLDYFTKALDSLVGWPGEIGLCGGEPTLHPQFPEILQLINKHKAKYPGSRFQMFTAHKENFEKYHELMQGTLCCVHLNEHNDYQKSVCLHQPATVAIGEMVKDKKLRESLIDNCWVQKVWAPVINEKGAYFCEVAGSLATVIDGPDGYPIERGWWDKTPEQFKEQRDFFCKRCGMALPMKRDILGSKIEQFTPRLLAEFQSHNAKGTGDDHVSVITRAFSNKEIEKNSIGWDPGNYRQDLEAVSEN